MYTYEGDESEKDIKDEEYDFSFKDFGFEIGEILIEERVWRRFGLGMMMMRKRRGGCD